MTLITIIAGLFLITIFVLCTKIYRISKELERCQINLFRSEKYASYYYDRYRELEAQNRKNR